MKIIKGADQMTYYISPYRRMAAMRNAMNRMFDDTLTEQTPDEREMLLAVDVRAVEDAYYITALVPGLDAEDLDIEVLNNTVSIRGEFKSDSDEQAKYMVCELPSGRFSRVISLPTATDANKVEATIKNGVLSLHVPKAEADRPKAIKVNSN
jgi:HSP20 family protein